ncbi:MAG: VWA domain-containing protein [Saprospiraceae bacterium]|nr:VWA domain-containing protein [Saprospiraceae bacterium]
MFRFEASSQFYLLALLPLMALLLMNARRASDRKLAALGSAGVPKKYLLSNGHRTRWRFASFLAVALLGIIALANPQFGKKVDSVRSRNVDVFIVLDASASMLCEDIKPDRLSRSKLWIRQFIERFPSERMGLISFAGRAYLHTPLTTDLSTVYQMVSTLTPDQLGTPGTGIAEALSLAEKSFANEQGHHKVVLLVSDGEDHEGGAGDQLANLRKTGISLFTLPVGTETGGRVPLPGGGVLADEYGKPVQTRPDRELLAALAKDGGGELLEMADGQDNFDRLRKKFDALARAEAAYQSFSDYRSYFQYFLFIACCLLFVDSYFCRRNV